MIHIQNSRMMRADFLGIRRAVYKGTSLSALLGGENLFQLTVSTAGLARQIARLLAVDVIQINGF